MCSPQILRAAKQSQHANATYRSIIGHNMSHAFGHRVAVCCNMLSTLQYIATRWPNACDMLRPTMLRRVVLACCDRLAGVFTCLDLDYSRCHKKLIQLLFIIDLKPAYLSSLSLVTRFGFILILPHAAVREKAVAFLLTFSHKKVWTKICQPKNVPRLKHLLTRDDRDELSHLAQEN